MKKLTGLKTKTAVFISGNGTNLKNLIKFSYQKTSPISINLVISNIKKAKGLQYIKNNNIEKKVISFKNQNNAEKKTMNILHKKRIELICLAGFMKILSKKFLKKFQGKIINIHPSLLPKYKGLNTHKRVLENNEEFSGCTIHYVTSKLDSGKIIMQKKIKIAKNDNAKSLQKKILKKEHKLYPEAIRKIFT
tara:strand:+ start:53 stop:628 length:576 start_codon:yes stop_codon:yes gene_type:complete